jgi:rhombotail lipoprotein
MIRSRFMIVLMVWMVGGCAASQGLHPDQLRNMLQQEEERFGSSPTLQLPATDSSLTTAPSIGLYLKPTGFLHRGFDWTDRDRETVLAWASKLQAEGATTSGKFVPQSSLKGDTFTELRASAARYGADILVIFDGASSVDRYNNYKAPLLYWTILGAYLVDGTQSDALCLVKASVWDVKTGARLFSEETDGLAKALGPASFVDDMEVISHARRQALGKLLELVAQKLRAMRIQPAAKPH